MKQEIMLTAYSMKRTGSKHTVLKTSRIPRRNGMEGGKEKGREGGERKGLQN